MLVGVSLNKQGAPQYVKMQVIPDVKGKTLVEFARQHIQPGATINSDAYRSYKALAKEGYDHQSIEFNVKDNPDHLKWLHMMILQRQSLYWRCVSRSGTQTSASISE